ncbi:hypothetical protein CYLTODRAFT_368671 [Cylindrobasidium torrendii FP15055 ss-10]|uniref:Uncharacterized protein n=1 Tax=Cylindrobasidium torrendii FP15055 ss-10 TaxID=1314674 RepID=A0A0D7BNN7_9AGAR|nr:hypothetical protein CYLTODRAFT_368671 [Cylindrobasidium torrendii FP15055 ss-10]
MARTGTRRLPQLTRLDYTLIPAPLDLSLPTLTEKADLPAIIVTPSSPRFPQDFSIAFLCEPAKPSLLERALSYTPSFKARTVVFLFLSLFILLAHVATHSLASRRPFLEMHVPATDAGTESVWRSWFGMQSWLGGDFVEDRRDALDFVITKA